MIDWIVDKWLTWRTGKDRATRQYEAWTEENICVRSSQIKNYYCGFKYVVKLDYQRTMSKFDPFWGPQFDYAELQQYTWPNRPLGQHGVFGIHRVFWDQWNQDYCMNELGGGDEAFFATNNEQDLLLVTLLYT